MPSYRYKAMDAAGARKSGRMDAASLAELESRLAHMGLDLIDANPVRAARPGARRLPRRTLIDFCFHLEQFCSAGIPIAQGLRDLRDSAVDAHFRAVVAVLAEEVEGGKELSRAMAEQRFAFDDVTVSLIRAGEESGKLPDILRRLTASLKWQDELASRLRYLALYPTLLTVVTLGLVAFMAIYLVPRLAGLMQGMGRELPLHTEVLMAVSRFIADWWPLLVGVPVAMLTMAAAAIERSPRLRCTWDAISLHLPVIGDILRKAILARFADVFALMYAAGIPILDALHATRNVAGNLAVAEGIRRAAHGVSAGESISAAFERTGLFPPLVLRMLRTGESTGALDEALRNAGYFLGRDVRDAVERMQTLMEPAAIVAIGVVMGWIILSVLGPVYDLIAGIGG